MNIQKVGVVGAGQMGAGIAQILIQSKITVVLVDLSEAMREKARAHLQKGLTRLLEKGKVSESIDIIMQRLTLTSEIKDVFDCDLCIEAIPEVEDYKKQLFLQLEEGLKKEAIIATNTSSISITRLASYTKRPEKFIGMHFMNPVPLMSLVEIIRGHCTSDETYETIKALAEHAGKVTVCSQDYPGFIVNRLLISMINEAFFALMEGVATAQDVDHAMKLGTNQPMGPFQLADFIGLDTCLAIMNVLYDGLKDSKYRPCPLLRKYVEAGLLGRKSGQGVYKY